jgi:hypothetical protein
VYSVVSAGLPSVEICDDRGEGQCCSLSGQSKSWRWISPLEFVVARIC